MSTTKYIVNNISDQTISDWGFGATGLTFPDDTVQPTAYTGVTEGPTGPTGEPGPTGPAGINISYGATPSGPTAAGSTGDIIIETVLGASPEIGYLYAYDPTNSRWVRFTGAAWDW